MKFVPQTQRTHPKRTILTPRSDAAKTHQTVKKTPGEIEAGGDTAALSRAMKIDKYDVNVILIEEEIAAAEAKVPEKLKAGIGFAHDNVRRFALPRIVFDH